MNMVRSLFVAIALFFVFINHIAAQCETWNDSPRRSEAQDAYKIYRPLVSGKKATDLEKWEQADFNIAFDNWEKVYGIAPAADGQRPSLYADGRLFHRALMLRNKGADDKKKEYAATVLRLYDEEIKCYGNEAALLGRKGYDMFYYLGYGYSDQTFEVLKMALEKGGLASEYIVLTPMAEMTVHLFQSKKLTKEAIRAIYDQLKACAEHNIQNNERFRQEYKDAKARMEKAFKRIEGFQLG